MTKLCVKAELEDIISDIVQCVTRADIMKRVAKIRKISISSRVQKHFRILVTKFESVLRDLRAESCAHRRDWVYEGIHVLINKDQFEFDLFIEVCDRLEMVQGFGHKKIKAELEAFHDQWMDKATLRSGKDVNKAVVDYKRSNNFNRELFSRKYYQKESPFSNKFEEHLWKGNTKKHFIEVMLRVPILIRLSQYYNSSNEKPLKRSDTKLRFVRIFDDSDMFSEPRGSLIKFRCFKSMGGIHGFTSTDEESTGSYEE